MSAAVRMASAAALGVKAQWITSTSSGLLNAAGLEHCQIGVQCLEVNQIQVSDDTEFLLNPTEP